MITCKNSTMLPITTTKHQQMTTWQALSILLITLVVVSLQVLNLNYQVQAVSMSQTKDVANLHETRSTNIQTQTPVIGILSQVLRNYKRFVNEHHLHIAASYVKWIESAGAQVLPILLNQNDSYYEQMFNQTNGLLFPGGDNLLDPTKRTPMMVAAKKLYQLAVDANDRGDYYPIWGTCLGLELLSVLSSNKNTLKSCQAKDTSLTMNFVTRGKLFAPSTYSNLPELSSDYSKVIIDILSSKNLTYNHHQKCLTDDGLEEAGLTNFYRPIAHSVDQYNEKFIAIFEAINYPFFGVQFHPEKAPFEFIIKKGQMNMPHSREAIAVSRYFADFFVTQAQLNGHKVNRSDIQAELIYANDPMYTAPKGDIYEQRYLFPYGGNDKQLITEEFVDHVPGDDEVIPEDVSCPERLNLSVNDKSARLVRRKEESRTNKDNRGKTSYV